MLYQTKTKFGGNLAVIDDNCNVSKFYAIAHALAEQLQVIFMNQVDTTDTLEWDFKYKNTKKVLVSIFFITIVRYI